MHTQTSKHTKITHRHGAATISHTRITVMRNGSIFLLLSWPISKTTPYPEQRFAPLVEDVAPGRPKLAHDWHVPEIRP